MRVKKIADVAYCTGQLIRATRSKMPSSECLVIAVILAMVAAVVFRWVWRIALLACNLSEKLPVANKMIQITQR